MYFFVVFWFRSLQKRSGTYLNALGVLFASNLQMEMGKTIRTIDKIRTFLDFTILGVMLSALRGKCILEKRTQNEKWKALKNIIFCQTTKLQLGIYIYIYIYMYNYQCEPVHIHARSIETRAIRHKATAMNREQHCRTAISSSYFERSGGPRKPQEASGSLRKP